jgi:hypothetical protein
MMAAGAPPHEQPAAGSSLGERAAHWRRRPWPDQPLDRNDRGSVGREHGAGDRVGLGAWSAPRQGT